MESIVVTTRAGSGADGWRDGIGLEAVFSLPGGLCYSAIDDSLLIADPYSLRIRRMFPAMEKRTLEQLKRALICELFESDALPVQPLIALILEFVDGNSMCLYRPGPAPDSKKQLLSVVYCLWVYR